MEMVDIWKVIAGIGIFLIGIEMLESALKNLMGRPFKLFLRKQTGNPLKAIAGGTIVTALLQSSSAVNFMVLAFVNTGVITMRNAFAVIMGTNLGTTLDSWIVAEVGFKVNIEAFAYPLVGVAGLIAFIYQGKGKFRSLLLFLIGFSFLFIGLGYMKSAMENEQMAEFFSHFAGSNNLTFLFIGFILTTITQSSTATIAITLSILHQQLIGFDSAIAVVIGSEVGTSIKLILGSLNGVAVKKRVAWGNFIYNLVTLLIGFTFLTEISNFITDVISIDDPLIGLVTFQTGINLLNIFLFLPFLNPYTRLMEKLFSDKNEHVSEYIYKTNPDVPDVAIDLLADESRFFVHRALLFATSAFKIEDALQITDGEFNNDKKFKSRTFYEQYEMLKQHHGEIQGFYIRLNTQSPGEKTFSEASFLIEAVRSCMHAVKCIKDVHSDAIELANSSHDVKYRFYLDLRKQARRVYLFIASVSRNETADNISKGLLQQLDLIMQDYKHNLSAIYNENTTHSISHIEIATLININREIFTSHKALVMCMKSLLLPEQYHEVFSELPTYQA